MARIIRTVHNTAGKSLRFLLVIGYSIILMAVFITVLARYVFHSPIWGLDELSGHSAIWLYMMGAAYGAYNRSHIKAEVVHLFIRNQRALTLVRAITTSLACIMACIMAEWSYEYVAFSIASHETIAAVGCRTVWFQFALLAGAVLMAIYFFVETVDLLRKGKGVEP